MSFTIAVESPLQSDVRALVAALSAWALEQTPREFCHHMTAEQMAQPDTTVFIAREGGKAIGMGALRRHANGVGELKRMYTLPQARGHGVAGRIVDEIERLARSERFTRLVLETGAVDSFQSAWRVYEGRGFTRCGAVLDYPSDTQHNIFYEKHLTQDAPRV